MIENRSFFTCKFRGGRQSRPLQGRASFVEVAVAPTSGHTSSPHRMHAANDERASGKKCRQHVNTHTNIRRHTHTFLQSLTLSSHHTYHTHHIHITPQTQRPHTQHSTPHHNTPQLLSPSPSPLNTHTHTHSHTQTS